MFNSLPRDSRDYIDWTWEQIAPYYAELAERPLNEGNVVDWLADRARINQLVEDIFSRLYVAVTLDTTDEAAEARYNRFNETVMPQAQIADQALKQKLLASGIEPADYAIELRAIRTEAELFREQNVPLFVEENKLRNEYDKIAGAQTVMWNGEEKTVAQMRPLYQEPDRMVREQAWRLVAERQLADRAAFNDLWVRMLTLRRQIAQNADLPDYRAFAWRSMQRFDYAPEDCFAFHRAIEETVVPAASRLYEKRRQRLGVETLRPWDLDVEPAGRPPLRPFQQVSNLIETSAQIFHQVDAQLGRYYDTMRQEALLDLENRKGKAPGGYCTSFPVSERPFIFMNAVGLHDDVQTLLHEGGHAFHVFEAAKLPIHRQRTAPIEFCEVASMSMELLAAPYLAAENGGFYHVEEANRARVEHLETMIQFWPYMAVVDAFQHWVYTHVDDAINPDNCDAVWAEQWDRFMKGIDYSGLEDVKATGWHRKLHIFQIPFYYVEYGLAQLGAAQVWRNALTDPAAATAAYRAALALGGTAPLPALFSAAGAKFAFDTATLGEAVSLIERTITQLDPA